jgi:hypothetical protein
MSLLLLLASCSQNSAMEKSADDPALRDFCTQTNAAASAVAVACPNVYNSPSGDNEADSFRERPTYEVQAYLVYTWSSSSEAFVEAMNACEYDEYYFSSYTEPSDYGTANADKCVDLKACFDAQGVTFPEEWPETSYFDMLADDTCGLQDLD